MRLATPLTFVYALSMATGLTLPADCGPSAPTTRVICHWASGPVSLPKLMVQIDIDAKRQVIKENYSNSDGSKLLDLFDMTSLSEEYINGQKEESTSGYFTDTVSISGDTVFWSRKGQGRLDMSHFFADTGLKDSGRLFEFSYERIFSLSLLSMEYKEEYKTIRPVPDSSIVTYNCVDQSSRQ